MAQFGVDQTLAASSAGALAPLGPPASLVLSGQCFVKTLERFDFYVCPFQAIWRVRTGSIAGSKPSLLGQWRGWGKPFVVNDDGGDAGAPPRKRRRWLTQQYVLGDLCALASPSPPPAPLNHFPATVLEEAESAAELVERRRRRSVTLQLRCLEDAAAAEAEAAKTEAAVAAAVAARATAAAAVAAGNIDAAAAAELQADVLFRNAPESLSAGAWELEEEGCAIALTVPLAMPCSLLEDFEA